MRNRDARSDVPLHAFLCLALTWVGGISSGQDRIKVSADNVIEMEIKDCIKSAVKAVNDEDLDGYLACFPASQHARRRRETGLLFVQHQVGMELLESHCLEKNDGRCEVAVRYCLLRDEKPTEIVATLTLSKSDEGWLITKEKVLTSKAHREEGPIRVADLGRQRDALNLLEQVNAGFQFAPGGCANGRCGE